MRSRTSTLASVVLALFSIGAPAAGAEDFEILVSGARALNEEMASRTNGNLPLVDGLQDSDANRAIWAELSPRALEQARKAHALRPESIEAAGVLANAYMFYASSLGIVSSILKGASSEYRDHANRLIRLDPSYEDGLGDFLLASFYLVAPWPIGDGDQARVHYERAAALSPDSVRNQYGLGVYCAREGDRERTRTHLSRVVSLPCNERSERLFCDFMKQESRRVLSGWEKP